MYKKIARVFYKELECILTDREFLNKIGLSKKHMLYILSQDTWQENINRLFVRECFTCSDILQICQNSLNLLEGKPSEGWLQYIYTYTLGKLFPEKVVEEQDKAKDAGRLFFLKVLRKFLDYEKEHNAFEPTLYIQNLNQEEISDCGARDEYIRYLELCDELYLYEFLRISKEITPYNLLGHIAGVHFVAMHTAKQLKKAGAPIDLALISGAAACHDVGKMGCKTSEASRIPYLHYYYTDCCLKRLGLPAIAHIAANHSTWDLELENLSVESLVLIYSDFRVKSSRNKQDVDEVHFFSLDAAFNVILSKLDNVDETKKQRYIRVYSKLKDFENYMISLGVNTDIEQTNMHQPEHKDPALMTSDEVVERLKELAIEHNIDVMNIFNSEIAFGNLLESARSERQWKSIRAYISIFDEYFTYMTQKQKMVIVQFLHEMLMHREGDIRRQAADLMGKIIASYDEEYRKEIPGDVKINHAYITASELWTRCLRAIIFQDHKVTEQHKRWIGYTLRIVLMSLLKHCRPEEKTAYIRTLLAYYQDVKIDDSTAFILLDSLPFIPLAMCSEDEKADLMTFACKLSKEESREIKIGVLRFVKYITKPDENMKISAEIYDKASMILENIEEEVLSAIYLKYQILMNMGREEDAMRKYSDILYKEKGKASDIFLENLKASTPWVLKIVNIDFLLEQVKRGDASEMLHVATHLSNLIKISERVTVRHSAGEGLIEVTKLLPLDQRNEVVIELTKGLEIGEYQVSKYIPQYLGELALYLHPNELDEFINELKKLMESTNDKVSSVTLDTLGVLTAKYFGYRERFSEDKARYEARRDLLLGMLLRGLANYHEVVSQEAFFVISKCFFATTELPMDEKYIIFKKIHKKMLTLITEQKESRLAAFNNAAALNDIYRFISDYTLERGGFALESPTKVAFFPGTFDPFSMGHKGIVAATRNLGFEVYLALDEFSWSKKTQPRMIRRQIVSMSVAGESNVYVFPDDIPINLSNPQDLKRLLTLWPDKELYLVVGSDVIANASSYKMTPEKYSVHHLNHVIFQRPRLADGEAARHIARRPCIKGDVIELTLPIQLEDISSTTIRENIDFNRDIANLIDPVVQNFIYDNSLYLREPQYKHVMQTKNINIIVEKGISPYVVNEIITEMPEAGCNKAEIKRYLERKDIHCVTIREGAINNKIAAFCTYQEVRSTDIYREVQHQEAATYIREHASGKIALLGGLYFVENTSVREPVQMILTEVLSECLKNDYAYAVYCRVDEGPTHPDIAAVLVRQGFTKLAFPGMTRELYAVDMSAPVSLLKNMESNIKEPFTHNSSVLSVVDSAHREIQKAIMELYPGKLIISFGSDILHHKLVKMITDRNNVPIEPFRRKGVGPYMCVPFGTILKGMAVPNTVTKTLHTEKVFDAAIHTFKIKEFPFYSPIINQIRTLRSFNRPVILVDDLLHKGYRIRELNPILKQEDVEVSEILVGILSGRGKDLMEIQNREADCVYFIPNLTGWFVESTLYPFVGGDSVEREQVVTAGMIPSINMILPYVMPQFLRSAREAAIYDFSMTCLKNTRDILKVLEEEYQSLYGKNLTLNRLSEAIVAPRIPDRGSCVNYDLNLAPSVYVSNDIEMLLRIKHATLA